MDNLNKFHFASGLFLEKENTESHWKHRIQPHVHDMHQEHSLETYLKIPPLRVRKQMSLI